MSLLDTCCHSRQIRRVEIKFPLDLYNVFLVQGVQCLFTERQVAPVVR